VVRALNKFYSQGLSALHVLSFFTSMLIIFQAAVFAFIALSFLLVLFVPISFASSSEIRSNTKQILFSGTSLWFVLVFLIGILNSFVA